VPVRRTLPAGTGLSRTSHPTSSANERRIFAVEVSPAKSSRFSASKIRRRISSGVSQSSGTRIVGPIAHAPANVFACAM
jgi:hypothetical protein